MTLQELQAKYGQPKPLTTPTAKPSTGALPSLQAKYGQPKTPFPTAKPTAVSESFNEKLNRFLGTPAFDMSQNQSGVVGTTGKSIVNSGQSLAKFGKGVVDFLNPVENIKKVAQVPGALWDTAKTQVDANTAQKMAQDGFQTVLNKIEEKKAKGEDTSHLENYLKQASSYDPKMQGTITQILGELGKATYHELTPPALQDAFRGEGTKALESVAEDPYQLAPLFLVAKGIAEKKLIVAKDAAGKPILDAAGKPTYKSLLETEVGQKIDKGISKVADTAIKPVEVPLKGAVKLGTALAKYGTSQATGLSPKTIETLINDPKAFSAKNVGQYTRDGIGAEVKTAIDSRITDLSDLGKGYEAIRNSNAKVDLPIETVGEILNKYKVDVDAQGRVRTTQESIPMSQGDVAALQNFIDIFNTSRLSANAFLNARTALSNMAKFDATKTNASTTFARELRSAYDKAGKEQIPGLEQLDQVYSGERTALKAIKRDYFNADGTFKDNAISKIANLNRAGRESVLARLETMMPGISKRISVLNALEDIANAQGQKVGTYGRAVLGGAGLAVGNLAAIVAAVLSSPSIAAQILRGYGRLKGIKTEVIEKTIKNVEKILTSDISDVAKKANIGLTIENVSNRKGVKPDSLDPLEDTGSAVKNRLNKYETEKLKESKKKISVDDDLVQTLRGTKGMTAKDIMKTHPNIKLTRDVVAKDVHGNKVTIPDGEKLTPYEMKDGKVLLQDGQTYLVSKNQFQNIKGNTVGGEPKPFAPELDTLQETVRGKSKWDGDELMDNGNVVANLVKNEDGTWSYQSDFSEGSVTFKTRKEAMENAEADVFGMGSQYETKYSQYTLPDGKNYREVLIKAPVEVKGGTDIAKLNALSEKRYGRSFEDLMGEQSVEAASFRKTIRDEFTAKYKKAPDANTTSNTYKSPHWDEPNVIAHLRLNERTYKGKQVTFMEELQSDWAKDMRSGNTKASNPMLKNWQELAIKRALKDAVENGSDYFSWIRGEQTSARYNLATQVKTVKWNPADTGSKTGKWIEIDAKNGEQMRWFVDKTGKMDTVAGTHGRGNSDFKGKKLDEVLGKGLADKIMAKEKGSLSGSGLKFGGEWADNLYDKQVPVLVKKLTGQQPIYMDMKLPIHKGQNWLFEDRAGAIKVTPQNLKVGDRISNNLRNEYVVTKILDDGNFEAVTKRYWEDSKDWSPGIRNEGRREASQTFEINSSKIKQMGIRLTPDVKAKVKGLAPDIKTSGQMFNK